MSLTYNQGLGLCIILCNGPHSGAPSKAVHQSVQGAPGPPELPTLLDRSDSFADRNVDAAGWPGLARARAYEQRFSRGRSERGGKLSGVAVVALWRRDRGQAQQAQNRDRLSDSAA